MASVCPTCHDRYGLAGAAQFGPSTVTRRRRSWSPGRSAAGARSDRITDRRAAGGHLRRVDARRSESSGRADSGTDRGSSLGHDGHAPPCRAVRHRQYRRPDRGARAVRINGRGRRHVETPVKPIVGKAAALRFTRWQAHAMGLQAATGGGLTGAELDALIPVPTGMPRTSRIVAGYLARVDSAGARLGRALLGARDWTAPDAIVFPTLALATLSAEASNDAVAATGPSTGARTLLGARLASLQEPLRLRRWHRPSAPAATSPRSSMTRTRRSSRRSRSVGRQTRRCRDRHLEFLVDVGEVVAKTALETITAPVLAVIRAVAGAVAVVAMIVSIVQPWGLRVTGDPATTRLAVGMSPACLGRSRPPSTSAASTTGHRRSRTAPQRPASRSRLSGRPVPQVVWQSLGQDPAALMTAGTGDATIPATGPATIATTTGAEPRTLPPATRRSASSGATFPCGARASASSARPSRASSSTAPGPDRRSPEADPRPDHC